MKVFSLNSRLFTRRGIARLAVAAAFLMAMSVSSFADDPALRVARVSLIEGQVNYQRAADNDNGWAGATANTPLNVNDQVQTGVNGRAEIQLTGRNIVRLDYDTSFRVIQFNTEATRFALPAGTATFRIDSLDPRQFQLTSAREAENWGSVYFEVDTPAAAVTLLKAGDYRIDARPDGTIDLIVRRGEAEIYNQQLGVVTVEQGRRIVVQGGAADSYQLARFDGRDEWDQWNDRRDNELDARPAVESARYVPVGVPGVCDLDYYGYWWNTPDYGYVWSPRAIAVDWAPYRLGAWRWDQFFGWTWISSEPWGWAPYHYGRWAFYSGKWCWVPRGGFSTGVAWSWSPALVAFVGFGQPAVHVGGYNWIGWVPLAPGERFFRQTTIINNTTINRNIETTRTVTQFRNFSAPGGVTGMNGRSFVDRRVVVNNIVPPPRELRSSADARLMPLRSDDFRPQRVETTRAFTAPAARTTSAPLVTRGVTKAPANITTRRSEPLVQRPEPQARQTERATPPRWIEPENGNTRIERHEPPALAVRPQRQLSLPPEAGHAMIVPRRIEPAPIFRGPRPAPPMERPRTAAPGNRHFGPVVR